MADFQASDSQPTIRTERLFLRLADPFSVSDCEEILYTYNQEGAAGNSVSGIKTVADVQKKFRLHGPRAEFCTLTSPPNGMCFLIYLTLDPKDNENSNEDAHGALAGKVSLNFRPEMPYPDLGFALLANYEGQGHATEAAHAVLRFWRDTVGVKEICLGTAPSNVKSQKLAERLGFVRAGTFDVIFGHPPNERRETGGLGYVLPGMQWQEGKTMKLTVGPEVEVPVQYEDP